MSAPLQGVKVLDFTRVLSGPSCTKTLRDLGADVTKIEPPAGDVGRGGVPHIGAMSVYYAQQNAGKRNLSIDLNFPEARDIVRAMCETADVIVENFRPGTLTRFGFGYADVIKFNPKVVYVSISGYGQTGPWRNRPAFAPTVHAETGLTDILEKHFEGAQTELRGDACSHADVYTGLQGVIAVLAALQHRNATGEGQHVDVSMAATMLSANERAGAQLAERDVADEPVALSANESPIFELPDGRRVTIATSPVFSPMFVKWCAMMRRTDFPIQNLPFGRFRRAGTNEALRIGVAIGDQVLDLAALGQLDPQIAVLLGPLAQGDLNGFMAHGRAARIALRHALFEGSRRSRRAPRRCGTRRPRRCWCRRTRPRWRCRAASATTPTSTPASITRRRSASCSVPTTRCCPTTSGCRSAITAAARRSASAASASRARGARPRARPTRRCSRRRAPRLRARAGLLRRPAQRARHAAGHGAGRGLAVRRHAAQRLVGARRAGLGVPAAGPVPRQELRDDDLAVDRHDGGARAVPRAVRARRRPTRSRCPTSTRRPTASAARSRSASRCGSRPPRCARRAAARARVAELVRRRLLDARATAGPPRQQRLQPAARRPDGQRHAERPGREPGRLAAGAEPGRQATVRAGNGETRTFLQDGDPKTKWRQPWNH
jgi:crotonobetainyl-CoA:carnitine CoA-transferase CaiB-like acyl-CoA transferase